MRWPRNCAARRPRNAPNGSPEPPLTLHLIPPPGGAPIEEAVFVLPGLNIHPDRLAPWHALLAGPGRPLALAPLTGYDHPGDPAQARAGAEVWLNDLHAAWSDLSGTAGWKAAPDHPSRLSLFGYSLGGLAGLCWAARTGVPLHRALLLSPALRLRPWVRWSIILPGLVLPGRLRIPSVAPPDYRFHPTTTVAAYRAVTGLERRLRPTLERWLGGDPGGLPRLFIAFHEQDELVDTEVFHRLHALFPGRVTLHPMHHPRGTGYPLHLGVDERTLGRGEWRRLHAAGAAFWNGDTQEAAPETAPEGEPAERGTALDPPDEPAPPPGERAP